MRFALLAALPLVLAAADPVPAPPEVGKALRAAAPAVAALQERFAGLGEALRLHFASGGAATAAIPAYALSGEEWLAVMRRFEPGQHDDTKVALEQLATLQAGSARTVASFSKREQRELGVTALADLLAGARYLGVSAEVRAEKDGAIAHEAVLIYAVPYLPDREGRLRVGRLRVEVRTAWDGRKLGVLQISDLDLDKP